LGGRPEAGQVGPGRQTGQECWVLSSGGWDLGGWDLGGWDLGGWDPGDWIS